MRHPVTKLEPLAIAPLREAQRVAHLVLGNPRPAPSLPRKPEGMSKQEWKARKAALRVAGATLLPGVEEPVARREAWSHKAQGTPETHAHAEAEARRDGALARLHVTGAIDAHQLAAAAEIALAHQALTADVAVRTAKLEPRSTGGGPDAASAERIAAVIRDRAYSDWRAAVAPHAAMLLTIIVDDIGVTIAARRSRMSNRRARAILVSALNRWRRG
ncbi:hypothetical protein GGR88_001353 [Sphingomonas jejuensis]|uniref:DUF2293 domain-containing protein n=1 Tax=Sphingomonas jejuensis TaxID=904715 RepID=A0ABX0XM40_9SPHN|nr:hypothetical protein [Sphingomonas jejuensis]NJC33879.1 hypothetical protein [Sphingomonas jejuensis]